MIRLRGLYRPLTRPSMSFLFSLFSSSASSSNPSSAQRQLMSAKSLVDDAIAGHTVAIFSKTYCSYSKRAKQLFASNYADVDTVIYELDNRDDGAQIQDYLAEKTGQRTVPNIFVNRKHVGGSDDVAALQDKGELKALITA
ncbi:glutaredoxin [Pleurotus eryngii]|uniref:Glutaredoxin n=1 Tax=Pleurotus eryngii TaxID=5323 RepID=A0A9P5ZX84_PLEER|nr:glutaredoxin [Pleurotus eryngii]